MQKVLIISYNFPPDGCGPVQRIAKFCKYLPDCGWQPTVITASGYRYSGKDQQLLDEIKDDISIMRIYDKGNLIPGEIRKRVSSLSIPDKRITWIKTAVKKAKKIIEDNEIDVLFTTSPPHSIQMIGLRLKEATGIPWVADFRDEWSFNPDFQKKPKKETQRYWEKKILQNADCIVCNTLSMKNNYLKLFPSDKYEVILNGFDQKDFSDIKWDEIKKGREHDKTCKFIYMGRLNRLHSPINFLKALTGLMDDEPDKVPPLSITFISNKESRKWLTGFEKHLEDGTIRFTGFIPHKECLEIAPNFDVSLLFATNVNNSEFIPGKIYEYLYIGNPIFGVIPEKMYLESFLKRYDNTFIAFDNSETSIKKALLELFNHIKMKKVPDKFPRIQLIQFSRERLTLKLADIFSNLVKEKVCWGKY